MRSHDVVRAFLRHISIREDLRVTLGGKSVRAYWTNKDRTHARAEYTRDGVRHYAYGLYVNGRLVPSAD